MCIKCKICNKEFEMLQGLSHHIKSVHKMEQKEYYDTYIKTKDEGKCKICGNPTNFWSFTKGYYKYCSQSCVHLDKEIQDKYNKTMLERYGFEHFFQDKNTQEKIRNSEGYANKKSSFTYPEVIDKLSKIRKSKIEQFEYDNNCTQSKKISEKYNSYYWLNMNLPILRLGRDTFIDNKYLSDIDVFMHNLDKIKHKAYSKIEKLIVDNIKSYYKETIIENSRQIIKPYELDIFLPKKNIAIEFNGTYYHSTEMGTDKKYHLQKSLLCKKQNIRLIHIYEFENLDEQLKLLKQLIKGKDNYPKNDYNKNNLVDGIEHIKPYLVKISNLHIYTVGKLL